MTCVTRIAVASLVAMVGVAGVGCEQWPGKSTSASTKKTPAASGTNPGVMPEGELVIPSQEAVARVNQTTISTTDAELAVGELKRLMQVYQQKWEPLPVEDKPDALDLSDVMNSLVDTELKAQDARARGLDRKTEIRRRLAYLLRSFYAQEWDRWQRDHASPTDEQIHEFYEKNKIGFVDPERIHVRQIVSETLAEAEAIRSQVIQGAVVAQLAREKSIGAGKEQGGDIGWHLRTFDLELQRRLGKLSPKDDVKAFFPQLEPVAFALEVGQISQPVKGPEGRYYLIQLEERKPAKQQQEVDVHDAIKELLTIQKIQEQLKALRDKAKVERMPDHLTGVTQ